MGMMMNRTAYQKLIDEDIEWLLKQPRTLEREHIHAILKESPTRLYGPEPKSIPSRSEKYEEWERMHSYVYTWEEWDKQYYYWCNHCEAWCDDNCICYAR